MTILMNQVIESPFPTLLESAIRRHADPTSGSDGDRLPKLKQDQVRRSLIEGLEAWHSMIE